MIAPDALVTATFVAITVQRGLELRVARRNAAIAAERGAREFGAGHYPAFFLLHGAWMLGWLIEAFVRGPQVSPQWPWWLVGFVAAGLLRYWAITSLGSRWNTRILVVPGDAPLRRGPYRWLAHPNYLAVVIELLCVPLLFGAWTTAAVCSGLNAVLLLVVRIPAERTALRWATAQTPGGHAPL